MRIVGEFLYPWIVRLSNEHLAIDVMAEIMGEEDILE